MTSLLTQIIQFIKGKYSILVILGLTIYALIYGINTGKYNTRGIIQNDVISYYAYLPAGFIYHDLGFDFVAEHIEDPDLRIWTHEAPSGKSVLKMPMGVAVLNAPFFLVAHLIAKITGVPATEYSAVYELFILLAAIFYFFWGLLLLRRILLQFFNQLITTLTFILVFLATNLFYYTSVEPGMSHVYSFFLFAALIRIVFLFFDHPGITRSVLLGLLAGLIVLVRPSNLVVFIIPFVYGLKNLNKVFLKPLLIVFVSAFLVILPQLIYWKLITGQWIYNSYGEERFYFSDPEIIKGLISYRKGWLVYTPIMIFSVMGLFLMKSKLSFFRIPLVLYLVLNTYIIFSWWCWWYGGGFGARPMVESYALLAFPLAAFINNLLRRFGRSYLLIIPLFGFFIYMNLFQTHQYRTTLLHWDSTSKELYWKVFLTHEWPENYDQLLVHPDYQAAKYRKK